MTANAEWWQKDRHGRVIEVGDVVDLRPDTPEHVDNVGTERRGRVESFGTGDWEGYVLVDWVGAGRFRIPNLELIVLLSRDMALGRLVGGRELTPALLEALAALGVSESEVARSSAAVAEHQQGS